jgi:hypothetical protein
VSVRLSLAPKSLFKDRKSVLAVGAIRLTTRRRWWINKPRQRIGWQAWEEGDDGDDDDGGDYFRGFGALQRCGRRHIYTHGIEGAQVHEFNRKANCQGNRVEAGRRSRAVHCQSCKSIIIDQTGPEPLYYPHYCPHYCPCITNNAPPAATSPLAQHVRPNDRTV